MDLQDFNAEILYFEADVNPEVEALLAKAASNYGPQSEDLLVKAQSLDENNLSALIGSYRFYFYQNRYLDGLSVANRILSVVAKKIGFPEDWRFISHSHVAKGSKESYSLTRLYFFALKAAAYLELRLLNFECGRQMLEKIVAMDSADRIGAKLLLDILSGHKADILPFPNKKSLEAC